MRKKLLSALLSVAMVASLLVGCGSEPATADAPANDTQTTAPSDGGDADDGGAAGGGELIGVSMPTKDLQRWNQDGENMKKELEAAGYTVDLQFASNDVPTQVSQIENMIANDCKLLVIASIEGDSLGTVLAQAKEKGIDVIAYDRLIMNSDAVTYYATFDNYLVGQKQGEFIEQELDLKNAAGPFNMEIVTGDPGDNNVNFFYGGAMDVLKPYIDEGKLVVKSGQVEKADVATANWATDAAQSRFEAILSSYYSDGTNLDVVLASNDSTALGVVNALDANYTGEWPIITGQDCDVANVKNIIAGKQSMSIFKDTRTLASKVVEMVDAIVKGEEIAGLDTETYDNGKGIVPSYLCEPVFADVNNYKELLVDSGYYSESDLQ